MNKIKKIFISLGVFLTGLISKVFAVPIDRDSLLIETKYGVVEPEPMIGGIMLSIGKSILPIILFVIGLFVILSKKITKKIKTLVISILVVLAILGYVVMNYIV